MGDEASVERALSGLRGWFASRGWTPWAWQEEAWRAQLGGRSGLVSVPTGAGKTYGAWIATLAEILAAGEPGLQFVHITPLRAVARDIELALGAPIRDLGLQLRIESRTGDTAPSLRARQKRSAPEVLVTTPESLALLLADPGCEAYFAGLRQVVLDEWHELVSSKRGSLLELCLARLRGIAPQVRTWALSATIGNLEEAARAACGTRDVPVVLRAEVERPVIVESLIPERIDAFPWAGHLGLSMLRAVASTIDPAVASIVFTNTRSQAERWFQALALELPQLEGRMALHHGSLDRTERERVERGLKSGSLRLVVATASLDLGVDFPPVERVFQIGSPKGVARLVQRAGRASHRPGAPCRVICVPAHALELVEISAVRRAIEAGAFEPRPPLSRPLDVLVQHLVSRALGGGFREDALLAEVRSAASWAELTETEYRWALSLVRDGGDALKAYPDHHRIVEVDGVHTVASPRIAQLHRMNIGTITSQAVMDVRLHRGERLGSIEESYIASLAPGQPFVFAGRILEVVSLGETVATVRPARSRTTETPHWGGTRLPWSESLAASVRGVIDAAARGIRPDDETRAVGPVLEAQARMSRIPRAGELLVERCETREGHHLFVFPFEGRLVHEALAALLSLRLQRRRRGTFSLTVNDYGFELLSTKPYPWDRHLDLGLFASDGLVEDALASVNAGELSRRQFRDVARVANLVYANRPGAVGALRGIQASASLLYDVFMQHDPGNLLLHQARREVLEAQFEESRLRRALSRLSALELTVQTTSAPSPLAFPLVAERARALLSSETLLERIEGLLPT